MNIIQAILDGTATAQDVQDHRVRVVLAELKRCQSGGHDPDACRDKHCMHGGEREAAYWHNALAYVLDTPVR